MGRVGGGCVVRGGVCFCGQAVPLLLRCRVPASSPGPGLRVSLCLKCVFVELDGPICPSRRRAYEIRVAVLNSQLELRSRGSGCKNMHRRIRQTCRIAYVSHGAGTVRGAGLSADG